MANTHSKAVFLLLLYIAGHAAGEAIGTNQGGGTDNRSCPIFRCQAGSNAKGRFDSVNPKFVEAFTYNATSPMPKDGQTECWQVCGYHNQGKGKADPVTFWQYEPYADGSGALCTCYGEEVCKDKHYIDPAHDNGMRPEMILVGKVCPANGTGDPHFVGADMSRFDFTGRPGEDYALISDSHVAIHAHFNGRWGEWMGRNKALTWMRQIAVLWGHHMVVFEAREGRESAYNTGYLQRLMVDGEVVKLRAEGDAKSFYDGQVEVSWSGQKKFVKGEFVDEYDIRVSDILTLRLTLRPEIEMMRTENDGIVHFTVDVLSARLSANVHGVLGQTYRPDFSGRLEQQTLVWSEVLKAMMVPGDNAEGFIDGSVDDYKVSELVRSDCTYCRFTRAETVDDETSRAIEMAAGVSSSYSDNGRSYSRKVLVGAF